MDYLPVEIIAPVMHLALPPIDPKHLASPNACADYMRALHEFRLVSWTWRAVLDAIPELWALVSSSFSADRIIKNLQNSRNSQLTIHYRGSSSRLSKIHFMQLVEPHRHRWRVVWLDGGSLEDFLHQLSHPAPLLETIYLHGYVPTTYDLESFSLLGHQVSNIRHVDLMQVLPYLNPSPFQDLRTFKLWYIWAHPISVDWLVEVLQRSPRLEELCLLDLNLQVPTMTAPIVTVTLDYLTLFNIKDIESNVVDYILRRINAPNCVQFRLTIDDAQPTNYDPSLLLDSALSSFEPVVQKLGRNAHLIMGVNSIFWYNTSLLEPMPLPIPFLLLEIEEIPLPPMIRWVERVVDPTNSDEHPDERVGTLYIGRGTPLGDAEIVSQLIRLKSVTQIWAQETGTDVRRLLRILGADGPEPAFPRLRKLGLQADGWNAHELLEMVSARFSEPARRCPHLVVSVRAPDYRDGGGSAFAPDTLSAIHAIAGVTVLFENPADPK